MEFIGYIIAFCTIAGFAFYIHSLQTNHRHEMRELEERSKKEKQEVWQETSDKYQKYMKNKIQRIVVAELQFLYAMNDDEAEQGYKILDGTASIFDFFEAKSVDERKVIFEKAKAEYKTE